jgi:LuxR family maltose regulon positive regulatory protein
MTAEDPISYRREAEHLMLVRLLLAQGAFEDALRLARRLQAQAQTEGRVGRLIECLIVQALAHQGRREWAQAAATLEQALLLAQPEGFVRLFLDEGDALAKLLLQAKTHGTAAGFAAALLAALGTTEASPQPLAQRLIEPLTARELEVLRLIDAGKSNHEIAADLIISPATAKRHISNLYGKLGAASRTQALALARDLDLLR